MRIALIFALLFAACITSWSQDALTTTMVTLQARRMPLNQAFRTIQQKTLLLFVYQPGVVDVYKDVLVPEGRFTVAAALDSILVGTDLDYSESNKNIIVFRKPVLLKVTGFVRDEETGGGLPGAYIHIKDTQRDHQTDENGYFEIAALSDDVMEVSFAGMLPGSFKIKEYANVRNMILTLRPITLEAVTVNGGYYQVSNREQTGNIVSTNRATLNNQPVSNPLQAIQTSMPGVYVQQPSGVPGSGLQIKIRGQNSLREGANNPLFLVDGIPYPAQSLSSVLTAGLIIPNSSSMNGISPSMIESIDVLKDADATAIYGSRGANGVVLLTTRRNAHPGFGIEMNVNSGISEVANFVKLLDRRQWLEMRQEAFTNDKATANYSNAPDLLLWDTTRSTDWQQKLIGDVARYTDALFSVYGGTREIKIFGACNINKQTNVFPGQFNYTRGSGLVNVNVTPANGKLDFSASASYSMEDNLLPPIDLTSLSVALSPVAPKVYTQEEDLNWENGTWVNPYSYLRNSVRAKSKYFLASSQTSYALLPVLKVKTNAGFTNIDRQEVNLRKISSQNPDVSDKPLTGTQTRSSVSSSTWILEPQVEYSDKFKWGRIIFLAGATLQRTFQEGATLVGYGYTTDATLSSIPSAPFIESYEPADNEYSYSSLFSRLSYNYRGRYFINITGRRDASSRFAPGMIANFGAVGAAWIFTREKFATNWEFLEYGKIRVSYGTAGNDQIPDYGFLDSYVTTDLTYGGKNGIYPARLANSTYSWELSKKFETGLQLGILKSSIQLELSYYRNHSTNQLLGRSLTATTGFETIEYNLPVIVRNSGLELLIDAVPINTQKVRWNTKLNVSFPKSKLVRYDNIKQSSDAHRYIVGESVDILNRYKYLGIDPQTGNFRYEDINGDAKYDDVDLQKTKTNGVHWYGGMENSITFNGFQLSVTLRYVSQTAQSLLKQFATPGSNESNQPVAVMNRWRNSEDVARYHRFTQSATGVREYLKGQARGENGYEDADYLQVKNIAFAYALSPGLCRRMALNSASVYVRSQNVYTITRYRGFDPENSNVRVLPPVRTITMGIQLTL